MAALFKRGIGVAHAAAAASVAAWSLSSSAWLNPAACTPVPAAAPAASSDSSVGPLVSRAMDGVDTFVELDLSKLSLDHHVIHGALRSEDSVHAYSLALNSDRSKLRAVARLGPKVCGHVGIVHGGCLATLLDDALGTLFLSKFGHGFTASLNISYRKPVPAGTTVVVRGEVTRVEPSKSGNSIKVYISGRIEDADDGVLYTEATSLFITKAPAAGAAAAAAGSLRDALAGALPPSSSAAVGVRDSGDLA